MRIITVVLFVFFRIRHRTDMWRRHASRLPHKHMPDYVLSSRLQASIVPPTIDAGEWALSPMEAVFPIIELVPTSP